MSIGKEKKHDAALLMGVREGYENEKGGPTREFLSSI
jgi:hypothetical protein